jgi:hypothetical protein
MSAAAGNGRHRGRSGWRALESADAGRVVAKQVAQIVVGILHFKILSGPNSHHKVESSHYCDAMIAILQSLGLFVADLFKSRGRLWRELISTPLQSPR